MQTLIYINPLKPGKLKDYQLFSETNIGPRKKEYAEMLKRYGLRNVKVFYHSIAGKELIIVVHEAEDNALERLANFSNSTNPYDQWFWQQLVDMHDFDSSETKAQQLFTFEY